MKIKLQQRKVLSYVLQELDYPILAKHAITSDDLLCEGYVNLAHLQSVAKTRYDLVAEMLFNRLIKSA